MNADRRRWFVRMLGVAIAAGVACSALAATPIPPGKWSFVWKDAKGRADRPLRVYTYRPRACDTTCPMVFVMHGSKDPVAPKSDRDALEAELEGAGANWQMLDFGGRLHSFAEEEKAAVLSSAARTARLRSSPRRFLARIRPSGPTRNVAGIARTL